MECRRWEICSELQQVVTVSWLLMCDCHLRLQLKTMSNDSMMHVANAVFTLLADLAMGWHHRDVCVAQSTRQIVRVQKHVSKIHAR